MRNEEGEIKCLGSLFRIGSRSREKQVAFFLFALRCCEAEIPFRLALLHPFAQAPQQGDGFFNPVVPCSGAQAQVMVVPILDGKKGAGGEQDSGLDRLAVEKIGVENLRQLDPDKKAAVML
ncbi:MAG: hypothetical protein C4519_06800 [Desulfobacteraceae bacterium]|nr:MAG: hypothetical protein C4519_06800 [Desulfobacteraceae bacterium]